MKNLLTALLCLLLVISASASNVLANTAANTQIVNTATLTYTGGSATASVTVSVALVQAAPTVTLTGGTAAYTAPNTPVIYDTLVIASNANGPATYHVTAAMGTSGGQAPVNTTGASVSDGGSGFDVTLGASVVTDGATIHNTGNTLIIPAPDPTHVTGSGPTLTVNGLTQGSVISLAAGARNITTIALNADGNYTITFDGTAITPLSVGTAIGEQKTFSNLTANNIRALPGTATLLGSPINVYAQATVTNATFTTLSGWALNQWTTTPASVTFIKYVRNATTDASVTGTPTSKSFTINGFAHNYYVSTSATSGVTAKPGESLEYVIEARNTSATAPLNGCAISDLVPVAYVTFGPNVYGGNTTNVFYIAPDNSTASFLTGAVGTSQASFVAGNNPNLIVNVGNGANNTTTGAIPAASGVVIAYQVVVK